MGFYHIYIYKIAVILKRYTGIDQYQIISFPWPNLYGLQYKIDNFTLEFSYRTSLQTNLSIQDICSLDSLYNLNNRSILLPTTHRSGPKTLEFSYRTSLKTNLFAITRNSNTPKNFLKGNNNELTFKEQTLWFQEKSI
jgi:hypothetical protein